MRIAAELVPRPGRDLHGVIAAHGSHAGGYVLFIRDGRLHFTYNYLATRVTTVTAEVTLPDVRSRSAWSSPGPGRAATSSCSTATCRSARATIPRTTPLTYGTPGFAVGFQPAGPIDPDLTGRADITPSVLRRVVIELTGRDPIRDTMLDPRVDLATQ